SWPSVLHPLSAFIGHPDVDVWNHAWGPWWWFETISSGQLPWETLLLRWPEGGILWFIDPMLAALGSVLVPIFGIAGAFNLVLWFYLAFTSWAGRRLALALGAAEDASW
ncbi:MAG: hypothetical protein QGG40_20085, partial [Myxococcota bacterium]|nr:hypothetical protein [Myxococcota bacterium]